MNNTMAKNATITTTLAAGSAASPYYFMANLTKSLCAPCCAATPPVFAPKFSVVGISAVGTGQYVATINVQGLITYDPCGTNCCAKTEPVNQNFTIPFASAAAPTSVSVSAGTTTNAISAQPCKVCGRVFVSETPLALAVA